jgi:hypothetical protein
MGFVNEDIGNRDRHTIDKDRNIILSKNGYSLDSYARKFILDIDGVHVNFEAKSIQNKHENSNPEEPYNVDVVWKINHLIVPKKLQSKQKEIRDLITEALKAYGINHKRENASHVAVDFDL